MRRCCARRPDDDHCREKSALALNLSNLFAAVLVWLLGGTPFVLWAKGVIALYEIALILALLAAGAVLVWSVWLVRRLARLAATLPET